MRYCPPLFTSSTFRKNMLSDSDRAKTFAYLSGVEYFETLWKRLADEVKTHETALTSGPTFDEHTITAQIEELNEQLRTCMDKQQSILLELTPLTKEDCKSKLDLAVRLKMAKSLVDSYTLIH